MWRVRRWGIRERYGVMMEGDLHSEEGSPVGLLGLMVPEVVVE